MKLRTFLFWLHLCVGLTLGLVIASMCISGTVLAFEPQLTAWSEHALQTVVPPEPMTPKLGVDQMLAPALQANPDARPSFLTIKADPSASAMAGFGREGIVFLNPYNGQVLGRGSKMREALHSVEEWHRWLGNKKIGKPVTGAAAIAFCGLALSGLYLWWPRHWSRRTLKPITLLSKKGHGKARDWNWHNVIGFWASPFILVITSTGIIMSYGLLAPSRSPKPSSPANVPAPTLDALVAEAQKSPQWTSITLRWPQRPGQYPNVFIQPMPGKRPLRAWMTPLHTGRQWGIPGQTINFFIALAGLLQIWTGFALAWRRWKSSYNSKKAARRNP